MSLCNISEGWHKIAVLVNGVNPGDGGTSVGGISFTLEPVDLAKVFVQVMENIKPYAATVYSELCAGTEVYPGEHERCELQLRGGAAERE